MSTKSNRFVAQKLKKLRCVITSAQCERECRRQLGVAAASKSDRSYQPRLRLTYRRCTTSWPAEAGHPRLSLLREGKS
jgi:hypothetical protein